MCTHSWELFKITEGAPIAIYTEQAGETWNKHIRSDKSGTAALARQCPIKFNTQNIFTRMMIQSHPYIARQKQHVKCSICGK